MLGTKKSKFAVIVGLGKTGLSCAKHLANLDIPFAITDSRVDPPELSQLRELYPQIEIKTGGFDLALMSKADELIVSQGVSFQEPTIQHCRERGIAVIGDIELFARKAKAPIVAITGSNAKSTVTTLVYHMAQAAGKDVRVGGNLGTPALDLIKEFEPELYVLEISNFQLETTYTLSPEVATILNITPDHLDRYKNYEEYVAAKRRIYAHCKKVVINRDDQLTWIANNSGSVLSFGQSEPKQGEFGLRQTNGESYLAYGKENLLSVKQLLIAGQQNWLNALAALAIGMQAGLPLSAMLKALQTFKGLPHRCEWITHQNGIDWYNDSKGTNVGATLAAIEGIGKQTVGNIILIAGGLGKHADFSPLVPAVEKYVKTVILFGQDKEQIKQVLAKGTKELITVADLTQAVYLAKEKALHGDAVLLSPACASFDMFNNFEHRGQVFCQLVRELFNES